MKQSSRIVGADKLIAKLKAHPGIIRREMQSVLDQEARALCKEYARVSGPGNGLTESPLTQAKKEVETDVRRVFATRDSPWRVMQLLKVHAPHLANAYWHAYKSKKPRSMAAILKKANLPEGMSKDQQRAARTAAGGRVPKDHVQVSLANASQVRVLIRQLQQRVGMAKAGWLCAAKALGGRIRSKYTRGDREVVVETFPKTVRDVARRFPGLGGARKTDSDGRLSVEIFTYAGHARKALSESNYQQATDKAQQKLAASFLLAIREVNRKLFKSA